MLEFVLGSPPARFFGVSDQLWTPNRKQDRKCRGMLGEAQGSLCFGLLEHEVALTTRALTTRRTQTIHLHVHYITPEHTFSR